MFAANSVYLNPTDYSEMKLDSKEQDALYIKLQQFVFLCAYHEKIESGHVGMNQLQRKNGNYTLSQELQATVFDIGAEVALHSVTFSVDLIGKSADKVEIDSEELADSFKKQFFQQVFVVRQDLAMDFNGKKLQLQVDEFDHAAVDGGVATGQWGQVINVTECCFKKMNGSKSTLTLTGGPAPGRNDNLFKQDFDFGKMGIGGLGEEFNKILRQAFAPRIYPGLVKQLGINFIRGMLLYGPPGCGKTLIARQIGKVLNSREPKIVNGPEILDKFVGGSEEKIRELFADAEQEQREMGDNSMLHIIIFDELDSIMKKRGSGGEGAGGNVQDGIVNQLLSKIDGVDSLNNILIIGMTNRKDMIDEAILRPGRLEMHVEIGLPDDNGRLQIINIHTDKIKKSNRMSKDALDNLELLAKRTKNYTGAEIEGLIRLTVSFALHEKVDLDNLKDVDEKSIMVEWKHFELALNDTVPAFGNKNEIVLKQLYANGIVDYGPSFSGMWTTLERLLNQTRISEKTPLLTVLLEGSVATGKTALAAKLCSESDFPFIRMISPDSLLGMSEREKCGELIRVFSDAYKSKLSIIFIDDIERVLDFTPVGMRFSNAILQTLMVLLKKPPPSTRLMVVATTSIAHLLEELQLSAAFNVIQHVSQLQQPDEYCKVLEEAAQFTPDASRNIATAITRPLGVKQLLMAAEMARAASTDQSGVSATVTADGFLECLNDCGF